MNTRPFWAVQITEASTVWSFSSRVGLVVWLGVACATGEPITVTISRISLVVDPGDNIDDVERRLTDLALARSREILARVSRLRSMLH